MSEQRWTDNEALAKYMTLHEGHYYATGSMHSHAVIGRALLTLEAEVAQLRLNDQKYCERLAWLQAANAAFKGMEAERDALKLALETSRVRVAALEATLRAFGPHMQSVVDALAGDTSVLRALMVEAMSEAVVGTESINSVADRILNGRGK